VANRSVPLVHMAICPECRSRQAESGLVDSVYAGQRLAVSREPNFAVYDWYTHAETLRRPTPRPPHCFDLGAIKSAAAHRQSDARRRGRAAVHQYLAAVERGWREMKGALPLRPACHHREERIRGHVQRCWSALLLIRVAEISTRPTWRTLRHQLDRL
jgi:hypothetical protein